LTRARLLVGALAIVLGACDARMPDFHGVALGMTPRDVRARFDAKGTFEAEPTADDFKMKFTPRGASTITSAVLEFHMGALVAIRADLSPNDPFARGPEIFTTKAIVLHRTRSPESIHVDELARDCPTHHAEAEKLAH
jgi:hypothetical protein